MNNTKATRESQTNFLKTLDRANQLHNEKSVERLIETAVLSSATYSEAIEYLRMMRREVEYRKPMYKHIDVAATIDVAISKLLKDGLTHPIGLRIDPSKVAIHSHQDSTEGNRKIDKTARDLLENRITNILKIKDPGELSLIPSLVETLVLLDRFYSPVVALDGEKTAKILTENIDPIS